MNELLVSRVTIISKDGNIHVSTPFCPDFPAKARAFGGVWKSPEWIFVQQEEQRVRDLCQKSFGEAGEGDAVERVNLVFTVIEDWKDGSTAAGTPALYLAGRLVAKKKGEKVIFGDGVAIHEGGFLVAEGKYPSIRAQIGTKFAMRGMPIAVLKNFTRALKRFKIEPEVVCDETAEELQPMTSAGEILRLQATVEALQNQLATARNISNRISRKHKEGKLSVEVLEVELPQLSAALRDPLRNSLKSQS